MAFKVGKPIRNDGTLWVWGSNTIGALGLGADTDHKSSPVQLGSLTNWKSIKSENLSTLAVRHDGTLWGWGNNGFGQLGLGDATHRSSPTQVGNLSNWEFVTPLDSSYSFAIKTDGTLWAIGNNSNGRLGLGDTTSRSSPTQVGNLTNWKYVDNKNGSVTAIKTDGTLWGWGINSTGNLGLGDSNDRSSPVQVGNLTNWKHTNCQSLSSVFTKTDGTLWATGYNGAGNLGLGDNVSKSSPVQVGNLTNWKYISSGQGYTVAVKTDGTLWAWGGNNLGQLGLGNTNDRSSPVQVGNLKTWKQIYTRSSGTFGVKTDGTLLAWGDNTNGNLGLGDIVERSSPTQVGTLNNWKHAIVSDDVISIGVKTYPVYVDYEKKLNLTRITWEELHRISSGELWVWGTNTAGRLGLGDVINRSSPVQVGLADYWKTWVDGNNRLFIWGDNTYGTLGDGTTNRSSPVQVGSLTNWKEVSVHYNNEFALAIKTDGTLWTWGRNSVGQLGAGTIVSRSSPVQVGLLNNWKSVTSGIDAALAIKTDGTLWGWGDNTNGKLGLGDINHRSSPVQVGSLTNWKQVGNCIANSNLAIKTDGTLWAWGTNASGQLGLGDINHRSSPVQVGSLTNWKQLALANNGSVLAIKTDGSLWGWGQNTNGGLGLGDIILRSSPVQVGSLTNWRYVGINNISSIVSIKTDGTLWAWGTNASGQLGLGDVIDRSSPVQVGNFTDWKELTPIGAIRYGIE